MEKKKHFFRLMTRVELAASDSKTVTALLEKQGLVKPSLKAEAAYVDIVLAKWEGWRWEDWFADNASIYPTEEFGIDLVEDLVADCEKAAANREAITEVFNVLKQRATERLRKEITAVRDDAKRILRDIGSTDMRLWYETVTE